MDRLSGGKAAPHAKGKRRPAGILRLGNAELSLHQEGNGPLQGRVLLARQLVPDVFGFLLLNDSYTRHGHKDALYQAGQRFLVGVVFVHEFFGKERADADNVSDASLDPLPSQGDMFYELAGHFFGGPTPQLVAEHRDPRTRATIADDKPHDLYLVDRQVFLFLWYLVSLSILPCELTCLPELQQQKDVGGDLLPKGNAFSRRPGTAENS